MHASEIPLLMHIYQQKL
uniref:Uncharacterized protein n=1 Tax=Arundo donax TaxID=35708 RepID=A0A0A9E1N4_ARUDO